MYGHNLDIDGLGTLTTLERTENFDIFNSGITKVYFSLFNFEN